MDTGIPICMADKARTKSGGILARLLKVLQETNGMNPAAIRTEQADRRLHGDRRGQEVPGGRKSKDQDV